MDEQLNRLDSIEELQQALIESAKRPILLFKHSLTCALSTRALNELRSHLDRADARISYKLITVQTARDVSDETSSRLRVAHESPQAILVRNGRLLWSASHSEITASALDQAVRRAIGSGEPAAD